MIVRPEVPFRSLVIALALSLFAGGPAARAQQVAPAPGATRHEIVRGTVTAADGKAVVGADVIATRAPDRQYKATRTDSSGQYIIDWPEGTGDYLVHVSSIGFDAFRKRVTTTGDTVLVVDAKLTSQDAVQTLAAVVSTAARARPTRDPLPLGDPGANEQGTSGIAGVVPPALAGNLAAIASTIPGVLTTADGPSVLGLGASQNSTTLNGMSFGGADVPRDASTRVRVSTSAYDPAKGWFSGANTNVELGAGNIFSSRRSHLTLDAPPLQYTDAVSSKLGQRNTNAQVSLGGDGELVADTWYYNFGLQGGRRSAAPVSLFTADADLLRHSGVSADSVDRLRALMTAAGIPFGASTPANATNDNVSFLGRLDHKPYDAISLGAARSTWGMTGYAKLAQAERLNTAPTGSLAHEGSSSQQIGMAQADYSTYFGKDYLAFVRSGLTWSRNRTASYLELPDARVIVASDLGGGDGGVAPLFFGGASGFGSDLRQKTWETTADVQFFAAGTPRHRVKINADARLDTYDQDVAANRFGAYSYNSLADFAANTPASFSRTLNSPRRSGGEWNGFAAVSDLFRINPTWQVMYGARVEGNAFTTAAAYNPQVFSLFGVRTDEAPASVHVSPRAGFTWNRTGQVRNGVIGSPIGTFTNSAPGVLRGGIGEFRSITPATLLSGPIAATGLPGALSRVSCIGSAVPTPQWQGYQSGTASIPTSCSDGSAGTFNDAAPLVQVVDASYAPPRSWRGNLSWASAFKGLDYTLEGVYSLNLNQPGSLDLNFAGVQQYTLPGEGRPMFVSGSSDIVPSTGLVSSSGSRSSSLYGRVMNNRGDGRSVSKQATITIRPDVFGRFGRAGFFLAGYTLASSRSYSNGFDGTTFGDPRTRSWIRGQLDARHQFVAQAGATFGPANVTLVGRAQSGLPFTPVIASDVNGDGIPNDRAFVPDPATVSDAATRAALQTLLASPQSSVGDCLARQIGSAAGANSCEGPWSGSLNAQIGIRGNGRFMSRRATVNLGLVNLLGGADQLVHGSSGLRGWGSLPTPDPVLFTVNGYDASAKQFKYSVNPRFGDTRPSSSTLRAPFQLTLDVAVDIGRQLEAQQVERWLSPGRTKRGQKASAADLQRRFQRNVPDLYRLILQQSDSLLLSREQVESLTRVQAEHRQRLDAIWLDLATRFANLPDQFDARDASKRLQTTIDQAWSLTRDDLKEKLHLILNPIQLTLLPGPVKGLMESTGPVQLRIFIAG
jgi:hypothetical protein